MRINKVILSFISVLWSQTLWADDSISKIKVTLDPWFIQFLEHGFKQLVYLRFAVAIVFFGCALISAVIGYITINSRYKKFGPHALEKPTEYIVQLFTVSIAGPVIFSILSIALFLATAVIVIPSLSIGSNIKIDGMEFGQRETNIFAPALTTTSNIKKPTAEDVKQLYLDAVTKFLSGTATNINTQQEISSPYDLFGESAAINTKNIQVEMSALGNGIAHLSVPLKTNTAQAILYIDASRIGDKWIFEPSKSNNSKNTQSEWQKLLQQGKASPQVNKPPN